MKNESLLKVDWSSIPKPADDGSAEHLEGAVIPSLELPSTGGGMVDLGNLPDWSALYFYPMTGRPGRPLPEGWDAIPGARGCTPQACAFRDLFLEFAECGVSSVFGISTQKPMDQQEASERLALPYPLLSDSRLELTNALALPTFEVEGRSLIKRLTLIVEGNRVAKVFFPVFPPDRNPRDVLEFMNSRRHQTGGGRVTL